MENTTFRRVQSGKLHPGTTVKFLPKVPSGKRCHTCGSYNVPGLEITIEGKEAVICQNCTNFLYYGHDNPRPEVWADYEEDDRGQAPSISK